MYAACPASSVWTRMAVDGGGYIGICHSTVLGMGMGLRRSL